MSGRVVHFEVPYDDAERARGLYADVFGWHVRSIPELGYDLVSTGPVDEEGMPTEPGYVGGGMSQRGEPLSRPVITIAVDDIDATLEKVRGGGGAQVGEKITAAEMGIAAYFDDSDGNLMGLWQNTP